MNKNLPSATSLGERLRAVREEQGLTLRQIAGLIGCDAGYLSRLENGKAENPSEMFLYAAQICLGINKEWLRTGQGEREAPLKIESFDMDPRAFAQALSDRIQPVKKFAADLNRWIEEMEDEIKSKAASKPGAKISYSVVRKPTKPDKEKPTDKKSDGSS